MTKIIQSFQRVVMTLFLCFVLISLYLNFSLAADYSADGDLVGQTSSETTPPSELQHDPQNTQPLFDVSLPRAHTEPFSAKEEASKALLQDTFTYDPNLLVDPFIPFIKPVETPPPEIPSPEEEAELPPEPKRPLTPLQKMNLGEIERGLKAIVWGELGRRAIIQDSAGKGYIVRVGTPLGRNDGVVTEIFNDRLVIQQQVWDRRLKRYVPKNQVVKLKKEAES